MIEKAFLHLLYECEIRNIDLPLDFVAHRLCPGATGEAMTQRAERLRKELIAEGHVVPPKAGKKGTNLNAEIRGHIRKYPGDAKNLLETRDVLFTEPMEDVAHADPTAYMLVHNRQSRDKRVKATAGSGKNVIHDAHHNSDSESSDSAGESEVDETPKKSRHSARLRSVPKKSLKEASDNDAEDEDDSYNESATSVSHLGYSDSVGAADYGVNIKDEDDGEALLGGRSDRVPPQQYQVPDSLAAYGGVNVTPGSFADAEDNDLVSFLALPKISSTDWLVHSQSLWPQPIWLVVVRPVDATQPCFCCSHWMEWTQRLHSCGRQLRPASDFRLRRHLYRRAHSSSCSHLYRR